LWNRHPACSILAFLEMSICELDLFLTNREGAKSAKEEKRREVFVGLMDLGWQFEKTKVLTANQNN
jgi:hypothetical protein